MNNEIVQGSAITLTFNLKQGCQIFSLDGFSSGNAFFAPQDTTTDPIEVSVSLLSSDLGQLQATLTPEQTALLAIGDSQQCQITFIQSSLTRIAIFNNAYSVVAPLFT